jgi:hypothetical protein
MYALSMSHFQLQEDEEERNKATMSFANWSSSRPVVIPESSYQGPGGFGGRTYHVSLISSEKGPVGAAESQKGKMSPLSSSLARVATFVGSLVGGGTDERPSPSPSPSPSHVLKSYLRAPSDNLEDYVERDDSSLLPHHHYSSQRQQRAAQQAMSSSAYGLLSRSLGVGQSSLLRGGDEGMSNVLSRPLGRVHGSAAGRERGTIEQDMMDGWGRRKSYAAKGAPPRSKWDKTSADLPTRRPPKSQSTAALSSLAHSPNASLHQSPMSMITENNPAASRSKRSSDAQSMSQDIAVIVGSLPSSFGTPFRAMKRVESTTSIASIASSSGYDRQSSIPSPTVHRTTPTVHQAALRQVRSQPYMLLDGAECQYVSSPDPAPPVHSPQQVQPTHFPICLICLEMLTPEDFQSGEAICLECGCSGDIALRHLTCAIEWNNAKGNLLCEVCKQLITNLPLIDPELLEAREAAKRRREPNFSINSDMTWADHAFDAIRMMWIVAICCVIFYDLSMSTSFLIGAASGVIYIALASIFRWIFGLCSHWRQLRRWEREREAQERQMSRERVERERRRRGMVGGREDLSEPLLISIQ